MGFFSILIFIAYGALFLSLWILRRERYSGVWALLIARYRIKKVPVVYPASEELVYVYMNHHWIEWSEAWLVFAPEGLYIRKPFVEGWVSASLLIPWEAITENRIIEVPKGKRMALNIRGVGYSVAIDCSHKKMIDHGGLGFYA